MLLRKNGRYLRRDKATNAEQHYYQAESFSPDQRLAFIWNSIQQLRTYCIQLVTVIECLETGRQAATDITSGTSLIIL